MNEEYKMISMLLIQMTCYEFNLFDKSRIVFICTIRLVIAIKRSKQLIVHIHLHHRNCDKISPSPVNRLVSLSISYFKENKCYAQCCQDRVKMDINSVLKWTSFCIYHWSVQFENINQTLNIDLIVTAFQQTVQSTGCDDRIHELFNAIFSNTVQLIREFEQ